MAKTRFLFSSDFHGSETVWRKFLNSSRHFDLDALIISGDMTGKFMVPIIEQPEGKYDAWVMGEYQQLTDEELPGFMHKLRLITYMPKIMDDDEFNRIAGDPNYKEEVFEELEQESIRHWLSLIPERVPPKCKVIMSPGNDDKFSVDAVIREEMKHNPQVIFGEEEVVELDHEHEVLCFGWANPTPFDSPRECSEEELEAKLEATVAKVRNLETAVFCIHVPPYDSGLDIAPAVTKDLRLDLAGGRPRYIPVGSKAVRKIIEKYQPLLGLHGHIHESPNRVKIGRTECLNPGSEYTEGLLKAFLVEIDGPKITKLQRVEA